MLQILSNFRCGLTQFFPVCLCKLTETWQLLPLISGNNMHMQVEYVLTRSFPVLLDYADAIRVCGFLDGKGDLLGDAVKIRDKLPWNIKNVLVMRFGYDKRVPLIQRLDIKESHNLLILVNKASRQLFLSDFAKNA